MCGTKATYEEATAVPGPRCFSTPPDPPWFGPIGFPRPCPWEPPEIGARLSPCLTSYFSGQSFSMWPKLLHYSSVSIQERDGIRVVLPYSIFSHLHRLLHLLHLLDCYPLLVPTWDLAHDEGGREDDCHQRVFGYFCFAATSKRVFLDCLECFRFGQINTDQRPKRRRTNQENSEMVMKW